MKMNDEDSRELKYSILKIIQIGIKNKILDRQETMDIIYLMEGE